MFYLGYSVFYLAVKSCAIPNGGREEMLCGKRSFCNVPVLYELKVTSLV